MTNEEKYSLEVVYEIWNDNTGEKIEVGPDRDGLDLFEIRDYIDRNTIGQRITFTRGQLEKLQTAINLILS